MSIADREPRVTERPEGMRALTERRIDPGTQRRENIDTRSPLSTMIPRGKDNTTPDARREIKR